MGEYMGAAIDALGDVGTLLRHNPIIILVAVITVVLFNVINLFLGLIPLIGPLLTFLVYPAFAGGLLGIIYAGRDGTAAVDDFVESIGDNYLSLLGGYVLLGVLSLTLIIGIALVSVFAFSASLQGLQSVGMVLKTLYAAVAIFVAVIWLLIQFFNIAIVAGDNLVQSFRTSISMAFEDPISTFGFTLAKSLITTVILAIPYLLVANSLSGLSTGTDTTIMTSLQNLGIILLAGIAAYIFVALPAVLIVTRTYHVAYFNRRQAQRA